MGKTVCIILNYNDADPAIGLAGELRESREIDEILLVDNHSSDDSWEKLSAFAVHPQSKGRTGENRKRGSGFRHGFFTGRKTAVFLLGSAAPLAGSAGHRPHLQEDF